jgi:hypothetical protein
MRGLLIGILVLALVLVGGGVVAATAYQAGITAGAIATTTEGGAVVAPVVVHGYGWGGWGWGPGLGFFSFFGFLLVLFLVFGLIRAIAGPRRGWGGPGRWDGPNGGPRQKFDEWHRESHGGGTTPPAPPAPPTVG